MPLLIQKMSAVSDSGDFGCWIVLDDSGKLGCKTVNRGKEQRMGPNNNGQNTSDELSAETTAALPDADIAELDELTSSGAEDAVESVLEGLPRGTALLIVKRGPNAGARFLLDRDVMSAGRHPDSDIFLDDITVSRRHAEVRRESGGFRLTDAGSLNGTYINRQPVDSGVLANGDEIQIGKFRLVFLTSLTTR